MLIRKTRPRVNRISHLTTISSTISDSTRLRFRPMRSKSIAAPTAMKKRPSSNPLKGSMSLSSSWRYSLRARTTPARNVPRAGLTPTLLISMAVPMTSSKAAAVNSSRMPVRAMKRKKGCSRYRPKRMMTATAAKTTSVSAQPGRPSTQVVA